MGREEQVEEREVLDSIFPDEIQGGSKSSSSQSYISLNFLSPQYLQLFSYQISLTQSTDISETEYRISVLLDIINDDGDESQPPTILLQVKYPEAYPEEPPILDLLPVPNAPVHPYFSVAGDKTTLLDDLKDTIEENMGMAMIFTLYSTLKDNAEQLVAERQAKARHEHEQKLLAAEREENKKFHGTPVTPETFKTWREGFRKEMEEQRVKEDDAEEAAEKKRNRGKDTVIQLTGKQLWERGLVGKVDEDENEDDDDSTLVEGVERVNVED
jgi:RWD domain